VAVSKDNTRTLVMLPKDFKVELEKLAKNDNRSLSNYILTVLQNHIIKYTDN